MRLAIFGSSVTSMKEHDHQPPTFVDLLFERYGRFDPFYATYRARSRCSEERILYFLKKIGHIDFAVIFHGYPHHEFCPASTEDFHHGWIDDEDRDYMQAAGIKRNFFNDISKDIPTTTDLLDFTLEPYEAQDLLREHSEKFYNIDLQLNRFHGSLFMIDQHLVDNGIKAVHCITKTHIPSWFTFRSGPVETRFSSWQYSPPYCCDYSQSNNAINEEGNCIIADTLTAHIEKALQ